MRKELADYLDALEKQRSLKPTEVVFLKKLINEETQFYQEKNKKKKEFEKRKKEEKEKEEQRQKEIEKERKEEKARHASPGALFW